MALTGDARIAPDIRLTLAYAPAGARSGLSALFALDAALHSVIRTTRDPMIGQMRLTWWHDALTRLDGAAPPAEPVLRALAAEVVPKGVGGGSLARLVEGWEELLDAAPDAAALARYAAGRGEGLFAAAAGLLGVAGGDPLAGAGQGWALADLARRADPAIAGTARTLAERALTGAFAQRWSRAARPIGALARLAMLELAGTRPLPAAMRMIRFRTLGR